MQQGSLGSVKWRFFNDCRIERPPADVLALSEYPVAISIHPSVCFPNGEYVCFRQHGPASPPVARLNGGIICLRRDRGKWSSQPALSHNSVQPCGFSASRAGPASTTVNSLEEAKPMTSPHTKFGSLQQYEKGGVQVVDDDPRHYVFSNVFEVASMSKPYEKVAVGQNLQYVIEALRAEGTSPWFAPSHDEAALVMDGEIEVHFIQPEKPLVPENKEGSIQLPSEPAGKKMG